MNKINNCLINLNNSCVPIWFMRQAGRYLPEFRNIRSQNPDFLKLCLNSNLASEITLQPIERFDLDAAIIFSDILVVPHAMGQLIEFRDGKGPWVPSFNLNKLLNTKASEFIGKLQPVYEAINKTRNKLSKDKSLIAFVAAPWTLLIYLLNLKVENKLDLRQLEKNENNLESIIKKLDEFLKIHILNQKKAGADTIQIFDSWAGLISSHNISKYCYNPNRSLSVFCRQNKIPVICFPKGLNKNLKKFAETVKPNGINLDYEVDPKWVNKNLNNLCLQGGMKPELLLDDEDKVLKETDRYLDIFKSKPYIFNLGHGILPQTNPEIIKKIVAKVRTMKR